MQVYVEEIEEASGQGITTYSLVRGMEVFSAEVRASGVDILQDDVELDSDHPLYSTLLKAVTEESYKEYK